jgi:hypothetical protein
VDNAGDDVIVWETRLKTRKNIMRVGQSPEG